MNNELWYVDCLEKAEFLVKNVLERAKNHEVLSVRIKSGKTRTSRQQAALEVWCKTVADYFNEAGVTREVKSSIYKDGALETSWAQHSVKDEIWRVMQRAIVKKESSAELTTQEIGRVYDQIVLSLGQKGLTLPAWPVKRE